MKKEYSRMIQVSLVFLFFAILGCASTNPYSNTWPDFQHKIQSGPSQSSMLASLPKDIKIIEPSSNIPVAIQKYSGIWYGNIDRHKTTDMKLVVEQIKQEGDSYVAIIIYAAASGRRKWEPTVLKLNGIFVNNELQVVLPGEKEMVIYRVRSDGNLDVKWIEINNKDRWAVGVMVKQPQ